MRLLAPDGTEVEEISYQTTRPDVSYSRSGGCDGFWTTHLAPSPGRANSLLGYLPLVYGVSN